MTRAIAAAVLALSFITAHAGTDASDIKIETLMQTGTAWDGSAYPRYPQGTPQFSVLRITIPAHTTMNWHSHPMPNVAYVLSGALTVEKKDGSVTRHFTAGQAVAEIVDVLHRGVTGDQPVELVVFYAGAQGQPLSIAAPAAAVAAGAAR